MLWLIDGYNLMHALGAISDRDRGREAFRRKRRRFLNDLAAALGSKRALETTVVFDASTPPADFDLETSYKGLNLVFALGDENADARIEQLIAGHSAPRALTVVSSDRRIRRAATRRKARSLSADEFLDELDRFRLANRQPGSSPNPSQSQTVDRSAPITPEESAYWESEFQGADAIPGVHDELAQGGPLLTDDEIARIQREVDREE
jgi:predicted RNA-binding protein with PIN domain